MLDNSSTYRIQFNAACTTGIFLRPLKIKPVILISIKTGLLVVTALNDMGRNIGHNDSGSSKDSFRSNYL